jgi:transcriptional regulator with XRE-family HTH domain
MKTKSTPRNRIAAERKTRGMTQQQLADAVGAHWITISKLERGRIKLTTDWLEKLAKPLGVRTMDLLPEASSPAFGHVLSDLEDHFSAQGNLLFPEDKTGRPRGLVSALIESSNYEPFLHAGDTILMVPLRSIEEKRRKELEGRLCFCDFGTKASRPGFLYSGKKPNTYDLFWLSRRVAIGASGSRIHLVTGLSFGL